MNGKEQNCRTKTGNVVRELYLIVEKQYEKRPEARKREFSQKLFAEIIGFKYPAVNSWIIGKRNPPQSVLKKIKGKLVRAGYELPEKIDGICSEQARVEIAEHHEIRKEQRTSAVIQIYFSVMQQYIKRQKNISACTNFSKFAFSQIVEMEYVTVARWLRGQSPSEQSLELLKQRIVRAGYRLPEILPDDEWKESFLQSEVCH